MVVLNQATSDEVTLRLVLESDVHGREYFDQYDTLTELLAGHRRLVRRSMKQSAKDGIERIVAVAIVPLNSYGDEDGYGFGLDVETPA